LKYVGAVGDTSAASTATGIADMCKQHVLNFLDLEDKMR
jgi:hypothetical protein